MSRKFHVITYLYETQTHRQGVWNLVRLSEKNDLNSAQTLWMDVYMHASIGFRMIQNQGGYFFNLSTMVTSSQQEQSLKCISTVEIISWQQPVNQGLLNGAFKTPCCYVKGHKTWSIPHPVGLCFCLVSVLLIYFDCVTYFYATVSIFIKNVAPRKKKQLS